jgi:predicted nuclease with TOPRIM domain
MATPKWPYTEVVAGVVVDYDAAAQQLVERMADRKSATEMLIEEDRKKTRQRLYRGRRLYRGSEMDLLQDRIQELEGEVVMLQDEKAGLQDEVNHLEDIVRDHDTEVVAGPPF